MKKQQSMKYLKNKSICERNWSQFSISSFVQFYGGPHLQSGFDSNESIYFRNVTTFVVAAFCVTKQIEFHLN